HKVKSLRVRRTGAKTFVEATIQVPDYLGFQGSHALASKIEEGLRRTLRVADVTIHVEPVERGVEELVEKVARGVEGVVEVHEVNVSYAHGGLHVTLHACVDPELSVQEAHELAVKIEEGLRREVEGVADVAVHVEPFEASRRRGTAVDEKELQRAVQEVVGSFGEGLSVKRVVTYVGRRRHINIDCSFSGQMSIEEAHKISSKIEEELRRRFTETVVTVHVEPGRGEDAP
ncbi:MAG: hypothetical protein N3H31_07605, partial [Candidatus Nezhaarchaeota archaeon]|nr:hypothetical protein [Candidatus Nezhaarchaeota archaeon]